jgi:hypothetical protein
MASFSFRMNSCSKEGSSEVVVIFLAQGCTKYMKKKETHNTASPLF